ncbi:MAG: bifunctional nuclease family protein [Methyloceanibacter sp.]
MNIEAVRVSLMNYQRLVVLKEKESRRYLPIWIGQAEADAIVLRLQGVDVARPMTHDLFTNVLGALGTHVTRVVVNSLENETFHAQIYLQAIGDDSDELEIDSRTSDAIALAVRNAAPIFVADAVLDEAGITLEDLAEEPADGVTRAPVPPVQEEELKRMSAFRDFIQGLDLDDFDQR